MQYYQSKLYKAKKDLILTQALSAYYKSMHEDHPDIDILEDIMTEHGFFEDEGDSESIDSKPTLSIIAGQGIPTKRTKKSKLKLCK